MPITPAGGNWQSEVNKLRTAGFALPRNPVMARLEARKVADAVGSGSLTDIMNRKAAADMARSRLSATRGVTGGMFKTASDLQMAMPKIRQPLSSLLDKGIPFNVSDPKELIELRRWCNTSDAPVWMGDYSFKPIGDIEPGEQVIGWEDEVWRWDDGTHDRKRRKLVRSTVLAVNRRIAPEVVRITFASGRTVKCTPDHEWLRYYAPNTKGQIRHGPEKSSTKRYTSDYAPLQVGSVARSVIVPTRPLAEPNKIAAAHYLAGMFDGDGTWRQRSIKIYQSEKTNPEIAKRIDWALDTLGMTYSRNVRQWTDQSHRGTEMVVWELCRGDKGDKSGKNRQQLVDFYNWAHPAKFDNERMDQAWLTYNFGEPDTVVSVESLGPGEVVSMQTTTGNYTAWGYASKNCRLFYSTHDLVPLLIDIYSKFPVTGLEFQSKDPLIEKFYTEMFLDDLNYEEFLPDAIGREYFVAGEVTTLAHFNESLGIWSSEEVINPDMIAVSKSLFVEQERVQLLVKELVDTLRTGPGGRPDTEERPSERLERTWEYCCTPQTRVLTADLQWVPVRSLRVGDEIVGFDEFAPGGKGNGRAWRNADVTATSIISAPTYEVNTDRGVVTCTGAHMWLAQGSQGMKWIRTDALKPGDQIRYMGDWDVEDSQDVGYMSGIFDGEGWLTVGPYGYWLGFDQKPGPVLDKAVSILEARKFQLSKTENPCGTVAVRILGGVTEIMRCLGIFRPVRLLPKFHRTLDGRHLPRKQLVEVISVEECGVQDVVALATSTKTLMAEGMFSHNTQLQKYYPEIIQAAARDDGLDISDALVSRLVNKASPWDLRGTPPLLRSFRTLLMEESLNAAQDAVADRLYSPMVLATMGIENMGDGEPWIPSQAELDDLRNDMQSALAADFKLLVHNLGVEVTSVFGRESVPDFAQDYDRIDAKLMQAWGIGQALIMGGTGAGGAYASSALNREVCEQLMVGFQKKVIRHMRKRMEIIAEAQEHYDYELKGGLRVPLYREIVEEDEETGEQRIVRVPKLLIPEVHFATLNLRDEATERQFIMELKQMGVPVSDKALAINIEVDFEQELEREAQETVDKMMAKAQAFKKAQDLCDMEGLPYPPELAAHLEATLQLRQMLGQTKMMDDQVKQMDMQTQQMMPAGQVGAMPGVPPPAPEDDGSGGGEPPPAGGDSGGAAPMDSMTGLDPSMMQGASPPMASGPSGAPMGDPSMMGATGGAEPPMNRTRPEESDEMRANSPRAAARKRKRATASERWAARVHGESSPAGERSKGRDASRFEVGPSSVGHSRHASEADVEAAVQRREMMARHSNTPLVSKLVKDPDFYRMVNAGGLRNQIQSDWPEIRAGNAPESEALLKDLLERYEHCTRVSPIWD